MTLSTYPLSEGLSHHASDIVAQEGAITNAPPSGTRWVCVVDPTDEQIPGCIPFTPGCGHAWTEPGSSVVVCPACQNPYGAINFAADQTSEERKCA